MKKFKFSLERVLDYKNQVEQSLRNHHSQIVNKVIDKENEIEQLEEQFVIYREKTESLKTGKINLIQLRQFEQYLSNLSTRIGEEKERLAQLKKEEEEAREQVIEAKKETSSIQMLKDKKKAEYQQIINKMQEQEIEEFVSNRSQRVY